MQKEVFEIFEDFTKLKQRKDKVAFLKEQGTLYPAVKDIVRGAFDPRLKFVLPEGKPPYSPNRPESVPSSLRKLHKQFGDYVEGARSTAMGKIKRETRNYNNKKQEK